MELKYSRTPLFRTNWNTEPSDYAENPDDWIFLIGYDGSFKFGYYFILSPCMLLYSLFITNSCTHQLIHFHSLHLKLHTLKMSVLRT